MIGRMLAFVVLVALAGCGAPFAAWQNSVGAAAQDCQAAIGPYDRERDRERDGPAEVARRVAGLPNQVDGTTIDGVDGLERLRAAHEDAPIFINGGSFARADFRGARLRNVCFVGSDLSSSDWRGTDMAGVAFINARLEGANLVGARLPRLLIRDANLKDADATGADFSGGRMDGTEQGSVENLNLTGANLSSFRFDVCRTIGSACWLGWHGRVHIGGANLTGADVSTHLSFSEWNSVLRRNGWERTRLDRTQITIEQLLDISNSSDLDVRGPLRLRGVDVTAEISPAEFQAIRPFLDTYNDYDLPRGEFVDTHLADLYRLALARDPSIVAEQRAWLAERDRCQSNYACLVTLYSRRIDRLHDQIGPPGWIRPGASALFIESQVRFAERIQTLPIYQRLLPVLIDGAFAGLVVRVNADGSIAAYGRADGPNGHTCGVNADRLTFDPATGWYSGPQRLEEGADPEPPELRNRPVPVLQFGDDWVHFWSGGRSGHQGADPRPSPYASCGFRASFGGGIRVPATDEQIAAALRRYRGQ